MLKRTKGEAAAEVTVRLSRIAVDIQKGLAGLREDNTCTDLEVVVHGRSFRCHKAVLASVSDYFKAMFQSGMKETVIDQATLENVSIVTFQTVIDIIYLKDDVVNPVSNIAEDELSDLLRTADMLQMHCLSRLCLELLEDTMATNNCIERWKTGKAILSDALVTLAWKYILANFDDVVACKSSDLLNFDFEDIISLTSDITLQVTNEISVWKIISDWINFSKPSREDKIPELLKNCCLTEIDPLLLTENIAFDESVNLNRRAMKLIQETVKFNNHPGDHGNVELKLRRCMGKEQTVILLGFVDDEDTCAFIKINHKGRFIAAIFENMCQEAACCVHGQSMYLSGGTNDDAKAMYKYDEDQTAWVRCPGELRIPLKHHVMVATDTSLYLIGCRSNEGINKTVLQYDLSSKQWHFRGEIVSPVEHASAVCMNEKIYLFGGASDEGPCLATDAVQMYDTQKYSATILQCKLPSPCAFSRAIKRQDNVYVVTCKGEVIRFSGINLDTTKQLAKIPDFNGRKHFALTMNNDVLTILGGVTLDEDGHRVISNKITSICVTTAEVSEKPPLKTPRIFCEALRVVLRSTLLDK